MIEIRPAADDDAPGMAELLNEIIRMGGTTALAEEVSAEDIVDWMARAAQRSSWHVAVANGAILGFQWAAPHDDLPPEVCDIATFVRVGATQGGIGSKLIAATKARAKALGYSEINANIRSDNDGGLAYYTRQGFVDVGRIEGYQMSNGLVVDKVLKRLPL